MHVLRATYRCLPCYLRSLSVSGHKSCDMQQITENIWAFVFKRGEFLMEKNSLAPDGSLLQDELTKIDTVSQSAS